MLIKYFEKHGLEWQAREALRRLLDVRELNLAGQWAGIPKVDIVMLRNVLIYFDMDTKRKILGKVRQILRPGGFVFLGTAETTMNLDDKYELTRANGAVYYKVRS
jgi:chemotaxis protein methyltransferase CheR